MEDEKCCCCGEKDYEKLNQVECQYDCLHWVCDRCLAIRKWTKMGNECKRHKWRVGSGIAELIDGKIITTKLNIWCERCSKKIKAHYSSSN